MKRLSRSEHVHWTGFTILLNLYLAPHCAGQVATSSPSASPSSFASASASASQPATPTLSVPKAAAATHIVTVGNAAHKFNPEVTRAEVGDVRNTLFSSSITKILLQENVEYYTEDDAYNRYAKQHNRSSSSNSFRQTTALCGQISQHHVSLTR